jgi:glycosyltransferase involved in cell wall biosynthesis
LLDVCPLLQQFGLDIRLVNFDYDERYARTIDEKAHRRKIIKERLGTVELIELHGTRLTIPGRLNVLGKNTVRFINEHLRFLPLSRKFFSTIRNSDVIYFLECQPPIYMLIVLASAALAGRRPVVVGLHVNPRLTPYESIMLRVFFRIGVLKGYHLINKVYESEIRKGVGCPMEYIPNGVNLERFSSHPLPKQIHDEFEVLFVGAMTTKKGADILPSIYSSLRNRESRFKLYICTPGGALRREVKEWAETSPDVEFLGYVPESELPDLYSRANVVLLPSRDEQFPLVSLEAQASGTPVVATDISGFRQSILPSRTAFLVAPYVPEGFAEELLRIRELWANDRTAYDQLCSASREHVSKNYQWNSIAGRLQKMLVEASR